AFVAALAELLDRLDRAVDRHPRHDLGVCEVTPAAAHLPDAVVGPLPHALDELDELAQRGPGLLVGSEAELAAGVHAREHLTVDVELELSRRRVAHAHG